ncbi:MAG: hypothetical protein M5Z89_08510 [Olivibacter sp.]|nr:hypothetical protein [Olivibacter sp. UJ_SKK_5.1]
MSEDSKIFQLAKKLKSLADRGVGGEKENASHLLLTLCKKHGIDMTLLEESVKKTHYLYLNDDYDERRFFEQVASSVIGDCSLIWYKYKLTRAKGKRRHGLTCTDAEFVEIMGKFDFYWSHYQKEVKIFYKAFIQKNRLWIKRDEHIEEEDKELTTEERKELWKIANMMEGMERKIFSKQIER